MTFINDLVKNQLEYKMRTAMQPGLSAFLLIFKLYASEHFLCLNIAV